MTTRAACCTILALGATLPGALPAQEDVSPDRLFERVAAEAWEWRLRDDPIFASTIGDRRYDGRLPETGLSASARRAEDLARFAARLDGIDRAALGEERRIDLDVFALWLGDERRELELGTHLIPITNRSGFHTRFPQLPTWLTFRSTRDYERYVERLDGFLAYARGHVELMRAGIERGMVLPRVVLEGVEGTLDPHIVDDPEKSLLFSPFVDIPASVPARERKRLVEEGRRAIAGSVVPGYREFRAFLVEEYLPAARGSVGASALPRGRELYEHRVRHFTTLDLSPKEIHETGLAEVARIRGEMKRVIARTGFTGSFEEFLTLLRTDPRFYVDSPEALLEKTAYVLKKMDGLLPRLFKTLPRTPYGIEEVPAYIAPKTTTAYYESAPADGTRGGTYFVNTYGLDARPTYEIEALSLHEAVPGHHLQSSLAHEMQDVLPFRRYAGFGAFVEGWALYAERLGLEVGFYEDPYSDFGRLTYEMWRACRLVVDTGLHRFGWSRQRAIDYMAENTALSLLNVQNEIDRYISWPGQALGYKIGELKIRELRSRAEDSLGKRFDLREFHDEILRHGALPLTILEGRIDAYIAGHRAGHPGGPRGAPGGGPAAARTPPTPR